MQYRGYHCTGGSAEVIRKGMLRPANTEFSGLVVSKEGYYPNARCSAARVFFTRIRASGRACGIEVGQQKDRSSPGYWNWDATENIIVLVDGMITHNISNKYATIFLLTIILIIIIFVIIFAAFLLGGEGAFLDRN